MTDEKRIEKNVNEKGEVSIWHKADTGHYSYFEQRTGAGRLILERFYHPNGNERLAIGYHDNGAMKFKNTYDDRGVLSRQTLWTENGQMTQSNEYLNSYRHGLCVKYSEKTGRLISRIEFLNDQFDGLSETYYTTPGAETLKERAWYSGGRIEGEYSRFYANGKPEESGCIRDGKHAGPRRQYFETGRIKRVWTYENGELHGPIEEYNEAGDLVRLVAMANGKQHGLEVTYGPSGKITSQNCYVNGTSTDDLSQCRAPSAEEEIISMYFETGELRSETTYKNGLRNGVYKVYYRDGKIAEEGAYSDGKLSGRVRQNRIDGSPAEDTCYSGGKKSGPRTRYFESGQIASIEDFQDDSQVAIRYYFENGQIRYSKEWSDFEKNKIRQYTDRGIQLSDVEYSSEVRHGRELIYNDSGILFSDGQFVYGAPIGEHRCYWENGQLKLALNYENGTLLELREFFANGLPAKVATFFPDGSIKNEEVFSPSSDSLPESQPGPKAGDVIGEYKILRSLGHGGMGDVYLASDASLERQVAVKTIRGTVNEESMARFLAEGRALAKIRHKNVIHIYSSGNHFGTPYIVMEYVNGWPLGSLIGKGLLGLSEQLKIFRQMVAGIAAVHAEKILHRDLKPGNVLVSQKLDVKIIDFGIAKVLDESRAGLTVTGFAIGTVKYLAPEVAAGHPASFQTDLYGLGIIFYEMLTGVAPFQGSTREETLRRIQTEPLQFPDEIRSLIPEDLLQLILKLTAKSAQDRPLNCSEVLKLLDQTSAGTLLQQMGLPEKENPEQMQLLRIGNLEEVRKNLLSRGCGPSEISLIINLACRIQMNLDEAGDKTLSVDHGSAVIVSTEAIDEATARLDKAKRSTN